MGGRHGVSKEMAFFVIAGVSGLDWQNSKGAALICHKPL